MNTNEQRKAENRRKDIAGIVAIALGLGIGIFIRSVRIGLLLGLVLGFLAISLLRRK
ncbi:MAG TPA: hypothetical protein VGC95_13975 [Chitinophagaceae bacterium]